MDKLVFVFNKGYRVTENGKIINPEGKEIPGSLSEENYRLFTVRIYGKNRNIFVHRLQAFQKFGEKIFEEGIMVRHLDGDSLNNFWENIGIGTNQDNQLDIPEHIRLSRSLYAASFVRKYDKETVRKFHSENGNSYKITMEEFGMSSKGTLHFILNS